MSSTKTGTLNLSSKSDKCWPKEDCDWSESEKGNTLILTCKKCGTVEWITETYCDCGELKILREIKQ